MLPRTVMARGERVQRFLRGLAKFIALVLVAGGIGVALGMGLSELAEDDEPAATSPQTTSDTAATPTPTPTPTTAPAAPATAPTSTSTSTVASVASTGTTASPPPSPAPRVRISILDARLFTDATPSGRREQRARVTVRTRADNTGAQRARLDPPTLRVGSVRIRADPAGARFDALGAGASQTVTLHFSLAGAATPKVVRDRRARLLIAGQSLALRVKVRAPEG